ncbi:DUF6276 family protein [Halomarina rubra]|uniref:DUF6276 family protein n=1 Tax=Halomarina rubra TaxID=2071873 RepID=A0ABD6AUN6_9EURY|nr:DUF6276 family protein [Halomarina rubra]
MSDRCPHCDAPTLAFAVPDELADHAPDDSGVAAICSRCLTLHDASDAPSETDFGRISEEFPEGEAGAAMALAVGYLDSLALHRRDIDAALAVVEREGADPLMLLDRLSAQGSLQPAVDLQRRRHQVEQLRE